MRAIKLAYEFTTLFSFITAFFGILMMLSIIESGETSVTPFAVLFVSLLSGLLSFAIYKYVEWQNAEEIRLRKYFNKHHDMQISIRNGEL